MAKLMQALVFTEYGSIDVLKFKDVEIPVPAEDEVLIKVHAVSINDFDLGIISGKPFFIRYFTGFFDQRSKYRYLVVMWQGALGRLGRT